MPAGQLDPANGLRVAVLVEAEDVNPGGRDVGEGERFTLPSSCEKDGIVPSLLTEITWRRSDAAGGEGRCWRGLAEDTGAGFCFFIRNSSLRLAFLLMVDGLGFFLALAWFTEAITLVSREKEKLEPAVRENLNTKPWLVSVWQRSRHLVAKLVSSTAVVFEYF